MNTFLKLKYLLYILYGKIMRWFLAQTFPGIYRWSRLGLFVFAQSKHDFLPILGALVLSLFEHCYAFAERWSLRSSLAKVDF